MINYKLLIYTFLSEQAAFLAIFTGEPGWQRLVIFIAGHLIGSLLLAVLITFSFPSRFSGSRKGIFPLFFFLNLFLPLLGAVATITLLLYFRRYLSVQERIEFSPLPLPPFMQEGSAVGPGMGEGGAWSRLRATALPRQQRLKALLSVGGGDGGQNFSRLLQLATGDLDDEVRLLAFNLHEKQEQKIQRSIAEGLDRLQQADTPQLEGSICRTLAFSYWEMVYSALVQEDLRRFYMEQAIWYAGRGVELLGDDPSLLLLVSRIELQRRDFDRAEQYLQQAEQAGADPLKLIPYQAELAFFRRDYSRVRRLLQQDSSIRFRPGIGPVFRFWGEV